MKFTTYAHNGVILLRCLGPKPSATLHRARLITGGHLMIMIYSLRLYAGYIIFVPLEGR